MLGRGIHLTFPVEKANMRKRLLQYWGINRKLVDENKQSKRERVNKLREGDGGVVDFGGVFQQVTLSPTVTAETDCIPT